MRVLILVDLLNDWALHNRAKALQRHMAGCTIDIKPALGTEAWMHHHQDYDLIHFNFTYGLTRYTDFILDNAHRCVVTIVNERSLMDGHGVDRVKFHDILASGVAKTAVNRKMAELCDAYYIPNGVDVHQFLRVVPATVGYSGSTDPCKNYDLIMKACEQLGLIFWPAVLNKSTGDRKHSHTTMPKYYQGLDVFVHASNTEGCSNTVLEALACNVPVLMTRQGDWEAFEGWVTYIEPTVEGIMKGLQPWTGRRLVEKTNSWEAITRRYQDIYEGVVNENNIRV